MHIEGHGKRLGDIYLVLNRNTPCLKIYLFSSNWNKNLHIPTPNPQRPYFKTERSSSKVNLKKKVIIIFRKSLQNRSENGLAHPLKYYKVLEIKTIRYWRGCFKTYLGFCFNQVGFGDRHKDECLWKEIFIICGSQEEGVCHAMTGHVK